MYMYVVVQLGSNSFLKLHFLPLDPSIGCTTHDQTVTAKEAKPRPLFIHSTVDDVSNLTVVKFRCDSMDLVGEVIQNFAKHFQISELNSVADFPAEFDAFTEVYVWLRCYMWRSLECMGVLLGMDGMWHLSI